MDKQAAHVLNAQAVRFFVQRLVVEWNIAGGKSCKQVANAGPAQPGQMLSGRWAPQRAVSSFAGVVSRLEADSSTPSNTVRSSRSEQRAQMFRR